MFPIDWELFTALEPHSCSLNCEDEQTLFEQGDDPTGLYLVRGGVANALIQSADGSTAAIFQASPGAVLGLPALTSGQPYSLSALAGPGADVSFVPRETFLQLVQERSVLALSVLNVLAREVHAAREAMTECRY
jgi:CRP-like cAMP-binding protein